MQLEILLLLSLSSSFSYRYLHATVREPGEEIDKVVNYFGAEPLTHVVIYRFGPQYTNLSLEMHLYLRFYYKKRLIFSLLPHTICISLLPPSPKTSLIYSLFSFSLLCFLPLLSPSPLSTPSLSTPVYIQERQVLQAAGTFRRRSGSVTSGNQTRSGEDHGNGRRSVNNNPGENSKYRTSICKEVLPRTSTLLNNYIRPFQCLQGVSYAEVYN